MKLVSRILAALVFSSQIFFAHTSFAQGVYPNRPVKLIAPFPPGGTSDVLGRMLAQKLTEELGQPIIVLAQAVILVTR